jgi:hypothetical protein
MVPSDHSSTLTKSIAYDDPNAVVPWLGTRRTGLFSTRHRPRNGSARTTGSVRNPEYIEPVWSSDLTVGHVADGEPQTSLTTAGPHLHRPPTRRRDRGPTHLPGSIINTGTRSYHLTSIPNQIPLSQSTLAPGGAEVPTRGQINSTVSSVKLRADLCYAPRERQVTKHVARGPCSSGGSSIWGISVTTDLDRLGRRSVLGLRLARRACHRDE